MRRVSFLVALMVVGLLLVTPGTLLAQKTAPGVAGRLRPGTARRLSSRVETLT